jgi:hypothetical protein
MSTLLRRKYELLYNFKAAVSWNLVNFATMEGGDSSHVVEERPVSSQTSEFKTQAEAAENLSTSPSSSGSEEGGFNVDQGICPWFLKGKCRYKSKCKLKHHVDICPYCNESMPAGKISASTHLSRCYKAHQVDD